MPRKGPAPKRVIPPDPVYNNRLAAKFINRLLLQGKRAVAEGIFYDAMGIIAERTNANPIEVFEKAMKNVMPVVEVKPRRVGGATYQVPVEIKGDRKQSLAMRWLIAAARGRGGKSMADKLASELLDASNNTGATIRKRDETHRMAEANKAFSHYRW